MIEGLLAGAITLVVSLASIQSLWLAASRGSLEHLREKLALVAASAAAAIDPERHATLTDPAMQNSAEYRLAIEPLRRILASAPELTYIYTAVLDGETVRFVLDAAEPGDHDGDGRDDHAKIGEPYVNAEPLIYYALTAHGGKGAVVTSAEPYEDVWGSFLTGYAPFYNADGTLAGVAGVDISANRYLAEVAEQRHAVLLGLIPACGLSAVVAFGVSRLRHAQIRSLDTLEDARRAASRLALIAQRTQNAVVVTNTAGAIEWVNTGFERITGYALAEVAGRQLADVLHGEDTHPEQIEILRRANAARTPVVVELLHYAKGGRPYWARVEVEPLFEEGRLTGFMTIEADITEAKESERLLRASEQRLALAMDGAELGAWDWNIATGHITYNSRWTAMLGYQPDEIEPDLRGWERLVHPDDVGPALDTIVAHLAGDTPSYAFEHRLRHKSGRWVWVLNKGRVIERDPFGRPLRACGTNLDISERKEMEHAREQEQLRFRLFVEQAPTAIAMLDTELRYLAISHRWIEDYGLDADNLVGRRHYDVFPETPERWKEIHQRCLAGETESCEADRFVRTDGEEQWIAWEVRPWRNADGEIGGIMMFTADITERVRNEQLLERTSRIARVGGWELDLTTMRPRWSPIVCQLHGVPEGYEPDLTEAIEFYAPEHRERVIRTIQDAIEKGENFTFEAELLTRSGERIWVESQGEPTMHEARCVRLCGVLRDITELKRTQDYLRQLSITDRLTGLPNRGHFTEELNAAVEDSRATGAPIAVLFFDFDRFKQINDAMGHAAGDALLVSIAMRFLDSVLEGDVVARFGGDEFVVLLRSARSETEATRIAQRLVSIFAAPHVIRGTQVVSTASVGVAYYCGDRETTGEALLCDADTALHEAKSDGKNRCRVFDADLRTSVNRRHAIEVALRSTDLASILSLEYRPVLSLESGAYVGIDASIRCASRAVAGVGPGEFLDIIDDAGLALPCFLWALRAACRAAREIRSVETLRDAWVLIPIAPRAVAHPMLLESTRATLRELDPPRGGICVALPEVAIADTRHDISATLRGLRAMGIGITLNDFGGGVSSLTCLKDRPIDAIRLDPALVGGPAGDRTISAILHATLTLAHNLGITTIATGIEHEEQFAPLQSMNCELVQGPAVGEASDLPSTIQRMAAGTGRGRKAA